MKTLGSVIKEFREEHALSMDEFSKRSGLSKGYISMLEKNANPRSGNPISPSLDTFNSVAKAINMDLDKLLHIVDMDSPVELSFKDLQKKAPNIIPLTKANRIPILGRIACGNPIFAEENYSGYFIADEMIKADYCLRVQGDSMIDACIHDGDIAFIQKADDVDNGSIAVVLHNDEATLKRVYKDNDKLILQPCNNKYLPIIINDEARILGKLVGVYHKCK